MCGPNRRNVIVLAALLAAAPLNGSEPKPPKPTSTTPPRRLLGESKLEHATAHTIAFAFNRAQGLAGAAALGREARVKGRTPQQVMDPRNWRAHLPKDWQPYDLQHPGSWNHTTGAVTASLLAGEDTERCADWLARHYEREVDGTYGLQGLEPNGYNSLHGLYRNASLWWALRHGNPRLARAAGRAVGDSLLIYAALSDDGGRVHLPGARGGKGPMPVQGAPSEELAAARGRTWSAPGYGPRWHEWEEAYGGRILRATLEQWPEKSWVLLQLSPADLDAPPVAKLRRIRLRWPMRLLRGRHCTVAYFPVLGGYDNPVPAVRFDRATGATELLRHPQESWTSSEMRSERSKNVLTARGLLRTGSKKNRSQEWTATMDVSCVAGAREVEVGAG
jgi:hypothetical protein